MLIRILYTGFLQMIVYLFFVNNYCKKVPMKRLGTPEDIAPSVAFLLSDDAKYITGQNIIIDGGWTSW